LIEFERERDQDLWSRYTFSVTHPRVFATSTPDARVVWDLLSSSGYVDEWTPPTEREYLHRELLHDWGTASEDTGHVVFVGPPERPVGQTSGSLIYPGTWLIHHLGMADDGRQPQEVLEDACELFTAQLQTILRTKNAEHFLICVSDGTRWNKRIYEDFVAGYSEGDSAASRFTVYRYAAPSTAPQDAGCVSGAVSRATAKQWRVISESLRTQVTPVEYRALGLDPDAIDLREFSAICARQHLLRTRAAFVYNEGGEDEAALLAETGPEGTNLFGLFNSCSIVGLTSRGVSTTAREALLQEAIRAFAIAGKRSFLFFDGPSSSPAPEVVSLGFQHISNAFRWVAHRNVIPAWSEYLRHAFRPMTAA
jgi:hypothetical protein